MVEKVWYILMNQDLRKSKPVFMPGQKKARRFMESGKGNGEGEKI